MFKRLFLALIIVMIVPVFFGSVYIYGNDPKEEKFRGMNGNAISVYSNHTFSEFSGSTSQTDSVKPGDIIDADGSQEIVIGVSDSGRYITMPLRDYQLEQLNE